MSKALQWVIGIGVALVAAALVFSMLAPLFLPRTAAAGYPMMNWPGHMLGPDHMFGNTGWGLPMPFFGLFGLMMLAWPLLFVGLIVWGIIALARHGPQPPVAPMPPAPVSQAVCSQCGQPLQPGWRHCPNCGRPVE